MILSAQSIRELCTVEKTLWCGKKRFVYTGLRSSFIRAVLNGREQFLKGRLIEPFFERTKEHGYTYGLSPAGYDIRVAENHLLRPGECELGSSMERFCLPNWLNMRIIDKSTWARQFLTVQNTNGEPGWEGYLTLELINHSRETIAITAGTAIAQVQFELLDMPTAQPYKGKYQNQRAGVVKAILEDLNES